MDGVLLVKKERGYTSFDAIARLKGILHQKKIGHMGTLDPEAEGVLPVCLGKATRLADHLGEGSKVYRAVLYLGVTTDTQDASGKLLSRRSVSVSEEDIRRTAAAFVGTQAQLTPMYSARKVQGKKLVDLARAGQVVERPTKDITIESLDILDIRLPRVTMRVRCSKGTYIRTLCQDMGEALGTGGMMESLVREEACGFKLEDCRSLNEWEAYSFAGCLEEHLLPLDRLLGRYPQFHLKPEARKPGENGNTLKLSQVGLAEEALGGAPLWGRDDRGETLGLYRYEAEKQQLKPLVMLNREAPEKPWRGPSPSVVSIGKFDGLHRGHQAIFAAMEKLAEEKQLRKLLFTFSLNPQAVMAGTGQSQLTVTAEKKALAREYGIDALTEIPFIPEIREMSAEAFLTQVLIGRLGMREIVVGPDCAFGKDRQGSVAFLEEKSRELGFGLTVVPKVQYAGEDISSKRIRGLLEEGLAEEAAACMGRPFAVESRVVYGNHLGEGLGFPTVNQRLEDGKFCPRRGVYLSRVTAGGKTYPAVSNVGLKPTVGGEALPGLETHILEPVGELYGTVIRTELLSFLRPEMKFESLEALQAALTRDRETALAAFAAGKEDQ